MIERKMTLQRFFTHEGRMLHHINGYNLTGEQILELDVRNEFIVWGTAKYAREYEAKQHA